MPELPEAETIVLGVRPAVCGQRLARAVLERPDIVVAGRRGFAAALAGRRVVEVFRRGKRIALRLDNHALLVFALGMTGRLTVNRASEPLLKHTHLRIPFGRKREELRFRDPRRFGRVWLLDGEKSDGDHPLKGLGVEPLEVGVRQFRELLRCKRQIKALLLDQGLIAGLGNIYCDESLYRARVHPLTRAISLAPEQAAALLRQIRKVLRSAISSGGSTLADYRDARGQPGRYRRKHQVYRRRGTPCRRCKTPIVRITAAGRSTHICPTCQRLIQ